MTPSTRRSTAARASDADERQVDDVTAILNEEAHTQPRSSGKKRRAGAAELVSSSPAKRANVSATPTSHAQSTETPTPRRQSGRLKARQSLLMMPPPRRRDIFEIPTQNGNIPEPAVRIEPVKKVRQLKGPTQRTASPLKGRGVIDTRTTALVNLDDSPRKKLPRKDVLQRIGLSIKGAVHPTSRLRDTTAPETQEPPEDEDIFAAAEREENGPESPDPLIALESDLLASQAAPKPRNEFSPTKAERRKARLAQASGASGTANSQSSTPMQPAMSLNPHSTTGARGENAPAFDGTRTGEPRKAHAGNVPSLPKGQVEPQHSQAQRPPTVVDHRSSATQSRRQGSEQQDAEAELRRQAAEAEAKHQRMIAEALRGIEAAVELHDCKAAWTDSLVAGAEIFEHRSSREPTSTRGKGAERYLKGLIKVYKQYARAGPGPSAELTGEEQEQMRKLRDRCNDICSFRHRPDDYRDRERAKMGRDVYEHLIPSTLTLAKYVLKARFRDHTLSEAGHKEVSRVLGIARHLVVSASRWRPRPSLEHGIKQKTRSGVAPNIRLILGRYKDALGQIGATRYVDELEIDQLKDLEALHAAVRYKRDDYWGRHWSNPASSPRTQPEPASQNQVVDIDDLEVDESASEDEDGEAAGHAQQLFARARPRPVRRPTEDIPPPNPVKWDDLENIALLNALQKHTTPSRFQHISSLHCGPGGRLEKYDMDQIMDQSRWLKQSMARQLENEFDGSWDWLRTVPD